MCIIINICFNEGTLTRIKEKHQPQGVRLENNDVNVIYIRKGEKRSIGVRKDNVIYRTLIEYQEDPFCRNMLYRSRPCLCGSLYHSRTTHSECLLNDQYNDS